MNVKFGLVFSNGNKGKNLNNNSNYKSVKHLKEMKWGGWKGWMGKAWCNKWKEYLAGITIRAMHHFSLSISCYSKYIAEPLLSANFIFDRFCMLSLIYDIFLLPIIKELIYKINHLKYLKAGSINKSVSNILFLIIVFIVNSKLKFVGDDYVLK